MDVPLSIPAFLSFEILAGMASWTLSDFAKLRLEVISFFLLCLLLLSLAFQLFWNGLQKDLPNWPKLRYRGAVGVLTVAVLLFGFLLTMITGARELMTPGAWKPKGATFVLADSQVSDPAALLEAARKQKILALRDALWTYAAQHNQALPPNRLAPEIPQDVWRTSDPGGTRFDYWPGAEADNGRRIVAVEPGVFGKSRFVLWSNGEAWLMGDKELAQAIKTQLEEN